MATLFETWKNITEENKKVVNALYNEMRERVINELELTEKELANHYFQAALEKVYEACATITATRQSIQGMRLFLNVSDKEFSEFVQENVQSGTEPLGLISMVALRRGLKEDFAE